MPYIGKIITVAKAAAGYGNTGLLTVIFLYWVAEGVTQTGGKTWIGVVSCGWGAIAGAYGMNACLITSAQRWRPSQWRLDAALPYLSPRIS